MKPFRFLAPTVAVCATAAAVLLAPVSVARAQVLKQVPGDALVVFKFNKLKPTSDKFAAFADKLGLAQMQPAMADPLGSMKEELGIKEGLDESGEAALVILNQDRAGKKEPAMLILAPVSDYKAFVGNFDGAKTEGAVTTTKLGNDNEDSFIAQWGNYAAISNDRAALDKKPEGLTAAAVAGKELDSKDIVLYANMKSARPKILDGLTKNRSKIIAEVEKNMQKAAGAGAAPAAEGEAPSPAGAAAANGKGAAQAQKMGPLVKAVVNRGLDLVEQVVRDADAATYGFVIGDAGINGTALVEFAKESPSAKRAAEFKNSDASMLGGLPGATKYMFFGGSADTAAAGKKLITDLAAPIEKEFATLGEEGKAMQQYLDAIKTYCGAVKMTAFGMATPSGMLGQDAIIQVVSLSQGDAKAIVESQRDMFKSQQALYDVMAMGGAKTDLKVDYKENAKTLDGVQLNQMSTSFAAPAGQQQTPQQMQMQQMMTFMYGPGGMNAYVGQLAPDKVVSSAGASDELMSKLIASAKTGDDALSKAAPVQATAAQLPKQRLMAAYVGLDQIATTVANYAKAFGMPINFQLPADLPPIGMTIGTDAGGSVIRADGHVPAQTLQSIIAAVMQVQMQMQGGQQPGGPGGL